MNSETGEFSRLRHDPRKPNGLGGEMIYSIIEDAQGYLWVSIWGAGVDRLDPKTGKFAHFRQDPDDPNSLGDDYVV